MSTTIDHHKLNIQSFILTGNDKKLRKVLTAARARFDEADDVCFGEFLDAPDLNAGQHKHTTALIYACWKKQRNCIRALLDAGASINGTDLDGNTAGFALASLGATTLLEESLEDTLDPNHINNKGETALHVASGYGQELCVRELLRFHADPTVKDKQGKTPLLYAAGCDSVDR